MFSFDSQIKSKAIGLLIDPDKTTINKEWIDVIGFAKPDYILIGGSQDFSFDRLDQNISKLKSELNIPILLFPGSKNQIHSGADALLALSVVQSRESKFIFESILDISSVVLQEKIPTFYTPYIILSNLGKTSVEKILGRNLQHILTPEEFKKYLFLLNLLTPKVAYLEAGSGAESPVNQLFVKLMKEQLSMTYLFVGGGITNTHQAREIWFSGADCVVVGNSVEKNLNFLVEICSTRDTINHN